MSNQTKLPTYSVVTCTLGRLDTLQGMVTSLLAQDVLPIEFVLVDGNSNRTIFQVVEQQLSESGISFVYISCPPSLVIQRNLGVAVTKGDAIFLLDDDLIIKPGFARAIVETYAVDKDGIVGGVQGTIDNWELDRPARDFFRRLFGLTRFGHGKLQPSCWPALLAECSAPTFVEVFSGALMTFRRSIFSQMAFDENLTTLWVGDDFDFSYRVSRRYRLVQIPSAKATHSGGVTVAQDSKRIIQNWRMTTINHLYLFRKHKYHTPIDWIWYLWAEVGSCLFAVRRAIFVDRGASVMGILDGYREILHQCADRHHQEVVG